jgi:glycosyltransferase involved in cell wall biosynthesis
MNIAWIFPHQEKCGIASYSRRYIDALKKAAAITCFDPAACTSDLAATLSTINQCELVHIQYEPSYFINGRRDLYTDLCEKINIPIVVSLHEVYRSFPDVYPRETITGNGPIAFLRRRQYDRRHPLQTAYRRNASRSFSAHAVLIHHDFQRAIVIEQGCRTEVVSIMPQPVPLFSGAQPPPPWNGERPLQIAALGFINPHFDYDLLFATLERLAMAWRFTWIGGIRRDEDTPLLETIFARIQEKRWTDRFVVTGWLPDNEFRMRLNDADLVCAFFTARSSSSSLAAAFGSLRPVIATPIPLTDELAKSGVLRLLPSDPDRLAEGIGDLATQNDLRSPLIAKVKAYCRDNNFDALSKRLLDLYHGILSAQGRGTK